MSMSEKEDSLLGPADSISLERSLQAHIDLEKSLRANNAEPNIASVDERKSITTPSNKAEAGEGPNDLEKSLQALVDGNINISTISRALSEASLTADPTHLVNLIQNTLKRKLDKEGGNKAPPNNVSFLKEPKPNKPSYPSTHITSEGLTTTPKNDRAPSLERVRCNLSNAKINSKPRSASQGTQQPLIRAVKPVSKHASVSEPPTPRDTPTPPLTKSTSVPYSLDASRRRRPSGARHSSPVKKSPKKVVLATNCTPTDDLRNLLEEAEVTPSISVTARKHLLHTSTPFHPNLNLSTVILDNLTRNKSISPLVNPDLSINPVDMDVSTISPNLFSTVQDARLPEVRHITPRGPTYHEVEINKRQGLGKLSVDDVDCEGVLTSHVWNKIKIPVVHNYSYDMKAVMKISQVWIGSLEIPEEMWKNVLNFQPESLVKIDSGTSSLEFRFFAKREGAFAVNVGLMCPGGSTSSAVARFQVEEPNLCVLTKNGHSVDFGTVPLRAKTSLPIMVINGGLSSLDVHLEIVSNTPIFTFSQDKEERTSMCCIPGGTRGSKESVAKEVKVWSDVGTIPEHSETRVYSAKLNIRLGSADSDILLGTIDILVRVCSAKLVFNVSGKEDYTCISGDKCMLNIPVYAVGPIPLEVEANHTEISEGKFTYEKKFKMLPGSEKTFTAQFTAKPGVYGKRWAEFVLKLVPGEVEYRIPVSIQILPRAQGNVFSESSPGLKLGVMGDSEGNLDRFPVESDQSLVNWFSVDLGCPEEQLLNLRNSSATTVNLNIMIRDSEAFKVMTLTGPETSDKLMFEPGETKVIKLVFTPKIADTFRGKLILKPVNLKVKGKIIKASIGLNGCGGGPAIRLLDLQERAESSYRLRLEKEPPTTTEFRVANNGTGLGFVRLVCHEEKGDQDSKIRVSPDSFLLKAGETKTVQVSISSGFNFLAANLAIFFGPELTRSVYKRARLLPGAARLSASPALMGLDFTKRIPREEDHPEAQYSGDLTGDDVKHFYNKTEKHSLSLEFPERTAMFNELDVEDTLSETRLDATSVLHSPPTTDCRRPGSILKISPQNLVLDQGAEAIVKVTNTGPVTVHWDLNWSDDHLTCSPPAGQLARGGQAILLISARKDFPVGSQGWRGQVDLFSDQTVDSITVQIKSQQIQANKLAVFPTLLDFSELQLGSLERKSVTLSNPSPDLVQWRGCIDAAFFSLGQPSGMLNPGQSLSVPVNFKPAAAGIHRGVLDFTSHAIRVSKVTIILLYPIPFFYVQ